MTMSRPVAPPVEVPAVPSSLFPSLFAPPVLPDVTSEAYQTARQLLADHPGTAGLPPMVLSSLAQQLVDALTGPLQDEVEQLQETLTETRQTLTAIDRARAAANRKLGRAVAELATLKPTLTVSC